ncbi:MAG: trypsin-like peptidase domain-containing protein [Bryobacteraceae bacterium]
MSYTNSLCVTAQVVVGPGRPDQTFPRVAGGEFSPEGFIRAVAESTFLVAGSDTAGTIFFLRSPSGVDKPFLAITAAHLLQGMRTDFATLYVPDRSKRSGTRRILIPIRENGAPLWLEHPTSDIAILKSRLPDDIARFVTIPARQLADPIASRAAGIGQGAQVYPMGFPSGQPTTDGYPLVRFGVISSHLPLDGDEASFDVDFKVMAGNSGSPICHRDSGLILGVVTTGKVLPDKSKQAPDLPMDLGQAIPAWRIRDLVQVEPAPIVYAPASTNGQFQGGWAPPALEAGKRPARRTGQ